MIKTFQNWGEIGHEGALQCVPERTVHFWNGYQVNENVIPGNKINSMESLLSQLSYDTKKSKNN